MGNGESSERFISFALAFIKESKEDLEVADELKESKKYSRSVSASQQCVEKSIKALLELEKVYVAEHDLSTFFVKFIYNNKRYEKYKKQLEEALEIIDYFEGEWGRTRYPREEKGKIIIPSEIYNIEKAEESYNKAEKCFNIINEIVNFIIKNKEAKNDKKTE